MTQPKYDKATRADSPLLEGMKNAVPCFLLAALEPAFYAVTAPLGVRKRVLGGRMEYGSSTAGTSFDIRKWLDGVVCVSNIEQQLHPNVEGRERKFV